MPSFGVEIFKSTYLRSTSLFVLHSCILLSYVKIYFATKMLIEIDVK